MYCENCELRVETDFVKTTDPEEVERLRISDDDVVDGDYSVDEVGDEVHTEYGIKTVAVRLDICGNCAESIIARTYLT